MARIALGTIAGFIAWMIAWFAGETILSAAWPDGYGVHQRAFQAAIESGGPYTADTTLLLVQVVLGTIVSLLSGFIAVMVARADKRAPLALGFLLLALGLLKAMMSWPYVPLWYHLVFTGLLLPMAILGGRLHQATGD